jgi:hypothetical protein
MEFGLFRRDVLFRAGYRFHDDLLRAESEVGQFDQGEGFARDVLGF